MDLSDWFRNKSFTSDWSSNHFDTWAEHLAKFRGHAVNVLEIGSWEGRSAIFFLESLPACSITCVDTFAGGDGLDKQAVAGVETRFDANLAPYQGRVRKIKSRSLLALDQLAQERRTFDVVYIDGSHARDDVLLDSVLAWRLLNPNGVCIWDDYRWGILHLATADRPQRAIDGFLDVYADELRVRHADDQIIVEKCLGGNATRQNVFRLPRTPANFMRFIRRQPLRR